MKVALRVLGIVAAAIGILLAVLLLYLAFADLGRHKGGIESFVTRQIGRPFAINGPFSLKLFPAIKVQADQVHIGNVSWSSTPQMLQVGHFATEIDLWSLVSGPVIVRNLELRDVTVVLEKDDKGEKNWTFGRSHPEIPADDSSESGFTKLPITIQHAMLSHLNSIYRVAGAPDRLAGVETLTVEPGAEGLLAVDGNGTLDGYNADLAGRIGPLKSLLSGRDIRLDLAGGLENLRFAAQGGFGRLNPLDGANLKISVTSPDIGTMLRNLRLPALATGQLDIKFDLKDAGERTSLNLSGQAGDISMHASGELAALGLRNSDLTINATVADAARLASVFDIRHVPASELAVSGHVISTPDAIKFDAVHATLDGYAVHVDGTIPAQRGGPAQLRFDLALRSLAILKANLPRLPLKVGGEVSYSAASDEGTWSPESLLSARDIRLNLAGNVGKTGFAVQGGLGRLDPLDGADLNVSVQDPDLDTLLRVLRLPAFATGPLDVKIALKDAGKRTHLDLTARVGDISMRTTGKLAMLGPRNSDLTFTARTADAARLASAFHIRDLPAGALAVAGHVVTTATGYKLDGVHATLGAYEAHVDGRLPAVRGGPAQLRFDLALPSLAILKASLPPLPMEVSGEVAYKAAPKGRTGSLESLLSARNIRLDLTGGVGNTDFAVKGGVGKLNPLDGADLTASVKNSDVGTLLRSLNLPGVATGQLDIEFSLKDAGDRTELDLTGQAGDLSIHTTGKLAVFGLRDSDLMFAAKGADAARLATLLDIKGVPTAAFAMDGHLVTTPVEFRFDGVHARLATMEALVDGALPRQRDRVTQLHFDLTAPSLADLKASLPPLPLKISGDIAHRPDEFRLTKLVARVGESQVHGTGTLTGNKNRRLSAEIDAPLLDLTPFLPEKSGAQTGPAPNSAPAPVDSGKEKRRFLFGEQPIPFPDLGTTRADVHLTSAETRFAQGVLHQVDATLSLENGRVQARMKSNGGFGGSMDGSIDLMPGDRAPALKLDLSLRNVRSGFAGGGVVPPGETPPLDLSLSLASTGTTPHQLASAASGSILLTQGPGKSKTSLLDRFGSDIIRQLFGKLNPFSKQDPYTQVDCTVARVDITDGKTIVAPVLMQTQKVAITANGTIDLKTEKLLLNFNTQPRQGIGISPGMFTNPFLDLTGTLTSPSIGVGGKGVASGAVAAATGGLSVLAKGAVDRVIGATNQCKEALEKAQHPASIEQAP